MRWRTLALVAALTVVAGCGRTASVGPPDVTPGPAERDLVGRWTDASGRELPDGTTASNGILVLAAGSGSSTCSDDHVTVFIQLAWPVGTPLDWTNGAYEDDRAPRYVRDTTDSALATLGTSDPDVALPARARPTGFGHQGNLLSVVPSDARAIYVTRPDGTTERWARLQSGVGCA